MEQILSGKFDKIRCVTYKDKFSVGNCSYNDLEISVKNKVVGCGSKVFGASKPGDVVIICANKGKDKYFTIGILYEKIDECDEWKKEGGFTWQYNWKYIEVYDIVKRDIQFQREYKEVCIKNKVDLTNMFHSRFCGIAYKQVLIDLLKDVL